MTDFMQIDNLRDIVDETPSKVVIATPLWKKEGERLVPVPNHGTFDHVSIDIHGEWIDNGNTPKDPTEFTRAQYTRVQQWYTQGLLYVEKKNIVRNRYQRVG